MTPRLMLPAPVFALAATVTFAAGEGEEASAAEKEMVLDPSTGEMVTAPEYGGTIRAVVNFKNEGIDPFYRYTSGVWISLTNEKLGGVDWAFDRSVVGFDTQYLPDMVVTGMLAESWENPDPLTYIFKIRDDVFWHDKAPVSGRQLTARDVKFNYERVAGLSGEKSAESAGELYDDLSIASITAPDDFTLVVKLNEPSLQAERALLLDFGAWILPPEVIEQFGDMQDWRNVAGTGLGVGFAATTLSVAVSLLIGGVAGFVGGKVDLAVQRLVDAWMSFPGLLLLTIMTIVGQGIPQIIGMLALASGVANSRVVRGAIIGIKGNPTSRQRVRSAVRRGGRCCATCGRTSRRRSSSSTRSRSGGRSSRRRR